MPFRDNQALVTFGNPTHTKQIWMKLLVPSLATYISNPSKVEYPQDKKHETTEKNIYLLFPCHLRKNLCNPLLSHIQEGWENIKSPSNSISFVMTWSRIAFRETLNSIYFYSYDVEIILVPSMPCLTWQRSWNVGWLGRPNFSIHNVSSPARRNLISKPQKPQVHFE